MKCVFTIFCSLSMLFVIGCGNGGEPKKDHIVNLKGEQCSIELKTVYPLIYSFDNLLVTASCIEAPLVRVYKNNEEVYTYGNTGRGPNEFLSFFPTAVLGDTLLINDTHLKALICLKVGDDGDGQYVKEVKRLKYQSVRSEEHNLSQTIGGVVKVSDDYFVGSAMWSDTSLFALCDSQMNVIRYFGELPFETDMEPLSLMTNFNGIIKSRNNMVVFAMFNFTYIMAYHIDGDGETRFEWSDEIFPMEFEIQQGGLKLYREKAFGICRGLHLTDRYIYVLVQETLAFDDYNGKVDSQLHPNAVYVYNYDGKRLCKMVADRGLMSFCVTADNSTLYGITASDIQLMSYDISGVTNSLEDFE